ncbi:FecR family protein [Candidatus Parcubacteria bacterium]|nr:FecR family protein [Candidatus Parcubacteria bacterium]
MKRYLIAAGALLLVAAGGAYAFMKGGGSEEYVTLAAEKSWIEVTTSSIYLLREDGSTERELHTGDELSAGDTVKSSASGKAVIHIPDGSALRLDKDSVILLTELRYDKDSETLRVKVTLLSGRIWSKVVALVTSSSSWEVKTTNAVATVRGTAFSMEHRAGISRVLGAEHTVLVRPLDPATGNFVGTTTGIMVGEGKVLELKKESLAAVAGGASAEAVLPLRNATARELDETWVKENKKEDTIIEQKLDAALERDLTDESAREALRGDLLDTRKKIETLRSASKDDASIEQTLDKTDEVVEFIKRLDPEGTPTRTEKTETTTAVPTTQTSASPAPAPASTGKPVSLSIAPSALAAPIIDGTRLSFKATLTFSDGIKKDVTTGVKWSTTGNIGSVDTFGLFTAKLRDEDSELGEIKGSIDAVWEEGGQSLTAPSATVIVTPKVETTTEAG